MCRWLAIALLWLACAAGAGEHSYFPLIEDSSYTYNGVFKEKKSTSKIWVKTEKREDGEAYLFVREGQQNDPSAIIGSNNIGGGVYFKADGAVTALPCLNKSALNNLQFKAAQTILKDPPVKGHVLEVKAYEGAMKIVYTVEGVEDITVPAGTFKDCIKLKLEEIWPEKKVSYTGQAWLAKGVGLVKWVRVTGRVDELVEYKIPEKK